MQRTTWETFWKKVSHTLPKLLEREWLFDFRVLKGSAVPLFCFVCFLPKFSCLYSKFSPAFFKRRPPASGQVEGQRPASPPAGGETLRRFFLGLSAVGTAAVGTTAAIGFLCASGFKEKAAKDVEFAGDSRCFVLAVGVYFEFEVFRAGCGGRTPQSSGFFPHTPPTPRL